MADRLLPCPFCGGTPKFDIGKTGRSRGGHYIECTECNVATRFVFAEMEDPKPILRDEWNTRASLDVAALLAEIERDDDED